MEVKEVKNYWLQGDTDSNLPTIPILSLSQHSFLKERNA